MNDKRHDGRDERGEGAFEERTRRAFDESVDALDAATLSRLNRARRAALAGKGGPGPVAGWRPVATAAVLAVLAVAFWPRQAPETPVAEPQLAVAVAPEEAEDLEIVLQEADLDMLAELEFYAWMEAEEDFRGVPAGSGNIG